MPAEELVKPSAVAFALLFTIPAPRKVWLCTAVPGGLYVPFARATSWT